MSNIPMPNGMRKEEIVENLLRHEYGYLPERAEFVEAKVVSVDKTFCAGKAVLKRIELSYRLREQVFTFPIYYTQCLLNANGRCFIHINFRDCVPDRYQPSEELVDSGYHVISFCYQDITSDDADFTNGLAGIVYPDGKRAGNQCGKIGLWAWAAIHVMDYAQTLEEIDKDCICVAGHSRLGKTALVAGMLDERFYCAFSNDSGCSGAAISRDKRGENIENICKYFPYWFAEDYQKYINNENSLPFDQHFLIAANVPHRVYVSSAAEDIWADPQKEYEACQLAQDYYKEHGLKVDLPEVLPNTDEAVHSGCIGYHIREGKHYFSRYDWIKFTEYIDKQKNI